MRYVDDFVGQAVQPKIGEAAHLRRVPGFGDWLDSGVAVPLDTRQRVESRLSTYLINAKKIGQDWGTRLGLTIGIGLCVLIVVIRVIVKVST